MKTVFVALAGALLMLAGMAGASQAAECSATAVSAPDGSALTILFDEMTVSAGEASASCSIVAPLDLPAGYSLGVYRVDYRGYAHLAKGQTAELSVDFNLGPKGNSRHYSRKVKGALDDEFALRENIGAGLMKRVGCGTAAALDVSVVLRLDGADGEAQATLDSSDGGARRGLIYHFDLKKCQP